MESIRNLFKIGYGPSSSHTMGPRKAAEIFKNQYPDSARFQVTLYSSLAATGKGHLTDKAMKDAFDPIPVEFIWLPNESLPYHPNGIKLEAFNTDSQLIDEWIVYSIGGGSLYSDHIESEDTHPIYHMHSMAEILDWTKKQGCTFWEYVEECEGQEIWDYLMEIWQAMVDSIEVGIETEGKLPGPLNLPRKAASYYIKGQSYSGSVKKRSLIFSFALAVSEQNASGGKIVTAPTCGSSGVVPAVLYYLKQNHNFSDIRILKALATAGIIGNLVKKNASIAGAAVGCQGEIGTACAMAAGAAAQIFGGTPSQIEYAAEMGLEHHLGLTCDPVCGLVQIPCIERSAFAAARALDACTFSILSDGRHLVSFDRVVKTMNQTGNDLPSIYRETSEGGLAVIN